MKATPLALTLILLASSVLAQTPPPAPIGAPSEPGEPLPPGAPTNDYELSAWCYGALDEYLLVYQTVKPDLRDIDRMWGSSVKNEREPYASDMAAARKELRVLSGAVMAAEKASPAAIAPRGALAVKKGRSIWAPTETKTHRELARAWLSWGLPDKCDSTARNLTANAAVLGAALKYNTPDPDTPPPAPMPAPAAPPPAPTDAVPPAPPSETIPTAPPT